MGGFLPSPTFAQPVRPIPLEANGTVLTMVGGVPTFAAASGGGGTLPAAIAYTSLAGTSNDVNPGSGFPTNIGRLVVTLSGADAIWTGLLAGSDGQLLWIFNNDAVNNLQLNVAAAGSAAANRFAGIGNLILPAQSSVLACYFAGTVNRWVLS